MLKTVEFTKEKMIKVFRGEKVEIERYKRLNGAFGDFKIHSKY